MGLSTVVEVFRHLQNVARATKTVSASETTPCTFCIFLVYGDIVYPSTTPTYTAPLESITWYVKVIPAGLSNSVTAAFQNELTSLVEGYLSEGSEVNHEVKGRQMQLLSMMLADMSEPTDVLVAKLNCETKCE